MTGPDYDIRLMRAIRRVIRAVDLHSKSLKQRADFTTPQLVCLTALAQKGPLTLKALSESIDLSPSTVLGIVDRLHAKGLVERRRGDRDRRQVMLSITDAGQGALLSAPYPLQHTLLEGFHGLSELEQSTLTLAMERVVELLGARNLDTAAILDGAPLPENRSAAAEEPLPVAEGVTDSRVVPLHGTGFDQPNGETA